MERSGVISCLLLTDSVSNSLILIKGSKRSFENRLRNMDKLYIILKGVSKRDSDVIQTFQKYIYLAILQVIFPKWIHLGPC